MLAIQHPTPRTANALTLTQTHMATTNRLILHYDIVSPWSHVAFVQLTTYAKLWSIPLELRAINLGYVMKTSGNRPPITVPNKARWMGGEMVRAEKFYGVHLTSGPKEFPFNSFPAMCALRVLQADYPLRKAKDDDDALFSATAYLFKRVWSDGLAPASLDVVAEELQNWGGMPKSDVDHVITKAGSKELRNLLNAEAVELVQHGGAFGAPWIIAQRGSDGTKVAFFGSDRMEQIAAFLGLPYKGPLGDGRVSASKL